MTEENSDPMVDGCISVEKGTYKNVVCVCAHAPCNIYIPNPNSATIPKVSVFSLMAYVIAILLSRR